MARTYKRDSQGRFKGSGVSGGSRFGKVKIPSRATVGLNARKAGIHSLALANGGTKYLSTSGTIRSLVGTGPLRNQINHNISSDAAVKAHRETLNSFKTTRTPSNGRTPSSPVRQVKKTRINGGNLGGSR